MSFFEMLSTLLIGPLKLIFEFIFTFAYKLTDHAGLSIIVLSVMMNFLLMPLYRRTDIIQEAARDTEEKLREGVDHIKKSYSGDERMMILQTYYRQNNYKPTDALNGSVSLLLEVPFFMAAYQFLSQMSLLQGVSLGPIADLSAPDALFAIGGFTINVLPVLMTVVNFVSSALYLKGFPLKTKIQLYAMALFFLVFLYESPSGLVLYWTMNNLFSLGKTLFYKLKNPGKAAVFGAAAAGLGLLYFALCVYKGGSLKGKNLAIILGIMLQLPLLLQLLGNKIHWRPKMDAKPDQKLFLLCAAFMALLTGLLIPTSVIASAAQDFVDTNLFQHPLWYCASSSCLAAGTFLIWMGVFYWLANDTAKAILDKLVCVLCGVMIVNYMFFGTDLGVIRSNLQYESGLDFTRTEQMINLLVVCAVAVVMLLIATKWKKTASLVLLTVVIALGGMSALNIVKINTSMKEFDDLDSVKQDVASFELSTTGKNVVVIMLDRAMGEYVPFIFNERPKLKEQFEGFTYYNNTVAFGGSTNLATPALFGGYEYTPVELNKRSSEKLAVKHSEALKVMPVLFSQEGYKVTVCDQPYPDYRSGSDASFYEAYPQINSYVTKGKFAGKELRAVVIKNNHRNFFCFGIMKSMPLLLQPTIYNLGLYGQVDASPYSGQKGYSASKAEGIFADFMDSFTVLQNLSQMTKITEKNTNTFLFLNNETAHDPMLLQAPEYLPAEFVDNTAYDADHEERFVLDGKVLESDSYLGMSNYHVNIAALIQVGNWLEQLKASGVYDNTRIILVSDHGYITQQMEDFVFYNEDGSVSNVDRYFPLLMVKDFGSGEFTTSTEFMTNADVPVLAAEGLIENPVNPFTGKQLTMDEKYAHDQLVILSNEFDIATNNGTAFLPSTWASVKENIWNKDNWSFHKEETVLTEHKLP